MLPNHRDVKPKDGGWSFDVALEALIRGRVFWGVTQVVLKRPSPDTCNPRLDHTSVISPVVRL